MLSGQSLFDVAADNMVVANSLRHQLLRFVASCDFAMHSLLQCPDASGPSVSNAEQAQRLSHQLRAMLWLNGNLLCDDFSIFSQDHIACRDNRGFCPANPCRKAR